MIKKLFYFTVISDFSVQPLSAYRYYYPVYTHSYNLNILNLNNSFHNTCKTFYKTFVVAVIKTWIMFF